MLIGTEMRAQGRMLQSMSNSTLRLLLIFWIWGFESIETILVKQALSKVRAARLPTRFHPLS